MTQTPPTFDRLAILTVNRFFRHYRPLPNVMRPDAPYHGCMYETYGEELAHVRRVDPCHVWTLCTEGGSDYVSHGFHIVNRLGYFLMSDPLIDAAPALLVAAVAALDIEADPFCIEDRLEGLRMAISKAMDN